MKFYQEGCDTYFVVHPYAPIGNAADIHGIIRIFTMLEDAKIYVDSVAKHKGVKCEITEQHVVNVNDPTDNGEFVDMPCSMCQSGCKPCGK